MNHTKTYWQEQADNMDLLIHSRVFAIEHYQQTNQLQEHCNNLQEQCGQLQEQCGRLQEQCGQLQEQYHDLQVTYDALTISPRIDPTSVPNGAWMCAIKQTECPIYNSRGGKILRLQYRIRDVLIPVGSVRRKCAAKVWHVVRKVKNKLH